MGLCEVSVPLRVTFDDASIMTVGMANYVAQMKAKQLQGLLWHCDLQFTALNKGTRIQALMDDDRESNVAVADDDVIDVGRVNDRVQVNCTKKT